VGFNKFSTKVVVLKCPFIVPQVDKFGDKDKITSNSLRSLCKTVLNDTNPTTNSASNRSKVIVNIIASILPGKTAGSIDTSKLIECATVVSAEEAELRLLKGILGTQGTLRPIFEGQLRQRRNVRERAMSLRKLVAESGLDYKALSEFYSSKEVETAGSDNSSVKSLLKSKLIGEVSDQDIEELIVLFDGHFRAPPPQQQHVVEHVTNGSAETEEVKKVIESDAPNSAKIEN
jgi:hypothetical protein